MTSRRFDERERSLHANQNVYLALYRDKPFVKGMSSVHVGDV